MDHSHKKHGRVRGLLCHRCNTAIGLLGDDKTRLRAAIEYLTTPPAKDVLGQRKLSVEECIEARLAKRRAGWTGPGTQIPV